MRIKKVHIDDLGVQFSEITNLFNDVKCTDDPNVPSPSRGGLIGHCHTTADGSIPLHLNDGVDHLLNLLVIGRLRSHPSIRAGELRLSVILRKSRIRYTSDIWQTTIAR